MKAVCLFTLCLLAGWASSEFAWKSGKTYTYAVRGRMMTGISEINTQYSGMEMDYKIQLTVLDTNTIILRPSDFTILEVHDKLNGGWRDADLTGEHSVDIQPDFKAYLESPIELVMVQGVIESIKVEKGLPVWAVNIKKAQVSHFVIDTAGVHTILEGNLNRQVDHMRVGYPSLESGRFYETMETTVHGQCKTYYTVSQNGAFVKPFPFQKSAQPEQDQTSEEAHHHHSSSEEIHHSEMDWHSTYHQHCQQDDQVFEIIKSINFTSCLDKPVLGFLAPSVSMNDRAGDNVFGSFGLRALISRILACGTTRRQFTILRIHAEEQVNVGLSRSEKLIAGGIKNFTLISITDNSQVVRLTNPIDVPTLVYKFAANKVHNPMTNDEVDSMDMSMEAMPIDTPMDHSSMNTKNNLLPIPTMDEAPMNTFLISPLRIDGMKTRVQVLLKEIVEDLTKPSGSETIADKETLSKMSTVAKIMRFWHYEDIQTVYHQIADKTSTEEDKTLHHMFLNLCAISGTNPHIKFLFDLIQRRVVSGEAASQLLMTLPMYIRTPTTDLLKAFFKLIQTLPTGPTSAVQVKTTAILSFTSLLHDACINTNTANTRYPVQIYGPFCDATFVQSEFLDHFIQQLEKYVVASDETAENGHWKVVYLTALGNIGHPAVIPIVQRLMDNMVNPFYKVKALYVLKNLIVSRSNQNIPRDTVHGMDRDTMDVLTDEVIEKMVLPILVSVAFDKGEHPEVRMAAITLIMYTTNADVTVWQQLAYLTWFDVSDQVRSFVVTSFRYMAGLQQPLAPIHWTIQQRARFVLSLCKPISPSWTKSHNIFSGLQLDSHLSGFFYQMSYFGSADSMIPNNIYFRNYNQFADGAFGLNPLEFSIHGHSTQKIMDYVWEKMWTPSGADRQGHEDLGLIRELLGLKQRTQTDEVVGSIYFKIRNEMERLLTVNKDTIDRMMTEFTDVTMKKLRTGLPINYQKTMHLGETVVEIPTMFGLPLTYKYEMPVHMSLKGHVKIVTDNSAVQLQADLHPVYAWEMHHRLSFKVPFASKKYQSGVQQQMVAEFPFRTLIGRGERGQWILALTPTHLHETSSSVNINLVTYHQKPYTAIVHDSLWPIHKPEGAEMKAVHSLETPTKMEWNWGQKMVGWSFLIQSESEYKMESEGWSGWTNFIRQFKTPAGWMNLGYLGGSTVHRSIRQLSLDMSKSETKTMVFVFGGNKHGEHEMKMDDEHENVGWTYALAILGKKTPIVAVEKTGTGIQNILVKGHPSTFAYLKHMMMMMNKVNLRVSLGDAVKEASKQLPVNIPSIAPIREHLMESAVDGDTWNGCFELRSVYERPTWANRQELIVLRKKLLSEDLMVNMKNELHFGQSCTDMPHQIKMEGNLRRGPEMTEWARTKSPQAKRCIEDEKKGFSVSPICLWVAEQQAAALNKVHMEFTWTENLPVPFKRMCFYFQDYLKSLFYPYMTHDRFPIESVAGDKKMTVDLALSPNKEYFNMTFINPETRLYFKNIRTTEMAKSFLPLTATQNMWENVRDRTLRTYSEPSCSLESNFISTFDNVSYTFDKTGSSEHCEHVLTQDCSGKWPMAVLVRNIHSTTNKVVSILLGGSTKIEIMPTTTSRTFRHSDTGRLRVLVNGRPVDSFPKTVRLEDTFIATIELMVNGGVQVISPKLRLATDATRVIVYGHNAYRNRTCGLCGDFDGETMAEFKSPKNCPLSSGSLLVSSYAFPPLHSSHDHDANTCMVKSEMKERIAREEADCENSMTMKPKTRTSFTKMDSNSESMETTDSDENDCYTTEPLLRRIEHFGVCHTEEPIRKCTPGCHSTSTMRKKVWFNCFDRSFATPMANEIRKQFYTEIPTNCARDL